MRKPPAMGVRATLAVLTVFAATACLDEEAIYDDDPFPSDPPSAAQGFLGYADEDAQLTVCGNCHEDLQHHWLETAHANAWESGGSEHNPTCQGCHSVSERGNVIAEPAGYMATGDERYQDVQCESCHGPGLEHVLDPSRSNAPYPSVEEGLTLTTGCGECHRGNEQPYLEELFASRHGMINVFPANQEGTCDQCHTGEGAINLMGLSFKNFDPADYEGKDNHMAVACLICHDPHGDGGDAMLRFPVSSPNLEANLCTQCHNERGNPDPNNERQPHAPAGPLLLGTAGYWPPTAARDRIVGSHGDPDVNDGLCATCHMHTFEASDGYETTGHLFVATPCLDSSGRPVISDDCATEEREYSSCATSGCHSDAAGARSAQQAARARLAALAVELRALLEDVPRSEFDDTDLGVTVAEGARFNAQLSDRRGSEVHNPALLEVLLLGSIESVELAYGLQASATLARTPFFDVH